MLLTLDRLALSYGCVLPSALVAEMAREAMAAVVVAIVKQSESDGVVNQVTAVVREADRAFERSGGSSRHWVRDCFLPRLNESGLCVAPIGSEGAK